MDVGARGRAEGLVRRRPQPLRPGPLLAGATTVLYEDKPVGTPDAGAFWRIVEEHGVKTMFTAPTALRAIRREDPGLTELAEEIVNRIAEEGSAAEVALPETVHSVLAARLDALSSTIRTRIGGAVMPHRRA